MVPAIFNELKFFQGNNKGKMEIIKLVQLNYNSAKCQEGLKIVKKIWILLIHSIQKEIYLVQKDFNLKNQGENFQTKRIHF